MPYVTIMFYVLDLSLLNLCVMEFLHYTVAPDLPVCKSVPLCWHIVSCVKVAAGDDIKAMSDRWKCFNCFAFCKIICPVMLSWLFLGYFHCTQLALCVNAEWISVHGDKGNSGKFWTLKVCADGRREGLEQFSVGRNMFRSWGLWSVCPLISDTVIKSQQQNIQVQSVRTWSAIYGCTLHIEKEIHLEKVVDFH